MKEKAILKYAQQLPRKALQLITGGKLAATCTKDCGGGKSVSCEGTSCSTTPEGCYAQIAPGSITYKSCFL